MFWNKILTFTEKQIRCGYYHIRTNSKFYSQKENTFYEKQ